LRRNSTLIAKQADVPHTPPTSKKLMTEKMKGLNLKKSTSQLPYFTGRCFAVFKRQTVLTKTQLGLKDYKSHSSKPAGPIAFSIAVAKAFESLVLGPLLEDPRAQVLEHQGRDEFG